MESCLNDWLSVAQDEKEINTISDLLDMVTGWCRPELKIY